MQIFNADFEQIPSRKRGLALGFFDGVHRGHTELVRTLVAAADNEGVVPALVTFAEHPQSTLKPDQPFAGYLTTAAERSAKLASLGIKELFVFPFDRALAQMTAEQFLDDILFNLLQVQLIVVGPDYRFGRQGTGDVTMLKLWGEQNGVKVVVVTEYLLYGDKVASSRIKELIQNAEPEKANALLGYPFSITGEVITGRGLGRNIGFPTANISLPAEKVRPAYGVYVSRAQVGSDTYLSITSLGVRPTVADDDLPLAETYLLGADQNLYGREMTVELLAWIRPEQTFASIDQLRERIGQDLNEARKWHRQAEQCYTRTVINGIKVRHLYSERFVSGSIHLVFRTKPELQEVAENQLLINVLAATTRRYPDRKELNLALDALYGADLSVTAQKQGNVQRLIFSADGLISFGPERPFPAVCELLWSILLEPDLSAEGLFQTKIVEAERQNLILSVKARANNPARHSYDQAIQIFCPEPWNVPASGTVEMLEKVTLEDLAKAYRRLLSEMELTLYIGGPLDDEMLNDCCRGLNKLPAAKRINFLPGSQPVVWKGAALRQKIVRQNVDQARLVMIYDGMPPYFKQHDWAVSALLNNLVGGDAHSILFQTIREEMGLAYQVFSLHHRYLGALVVMAGVSPLKVEQTRIEIEEQLKRLADGKLDPVLFSRSQKMLTADLKAAQDDLAELLLLDSQRENTGNNLAIADLISQIEQLRAEDICALARRLVLKTTLIITERAKERS